jgi:peptidoglycan/xylan/chitin deacetylase (PgdA/CDA1 family)
LEQYVNTLSAKRYSSFRSIIVGAVKSQLAAQWIWTNFLREWSANDILVLTYHRIGAKESGAPISSEQFAAQIDWLAERCEIMHPESLAEFFAGEMTSGRPKVCLTFDDGHSCLHDIVYPILRYRNLRAVAFLATGPITTGDYVWTDDVRQRLLVADQTSLELPFFGTRSLLDKKQRLNLASDVINDLKRRADNERRVFVNELQRMVTLRHASSPMITWSEAASMGDVFHWGAHTHSHPVLSRVSADIARDEILLSRKIIVEKTGQPVNLFAYPNGSRDDYSDAVKSILKEEGFTAAFTTNAGFVSRSDDLFELNRCPTTAPKLTDFAWLTARPSWAA